MSDLIPDEEQLAEANKRYPPDHEVDDPHGETGVARSDPYGYDATANKAFLEGAMWERGRRPSSATREALEEVVGFLASYGEYVEVEVAIEHVRSLSRFVLPEPAEVQHLWDPEGNSMCGGGGTFDEAPDLGDRLIDIPVCAKCFVEIRREQRDSRWGSEPPRMREALDAVLALHRPVYRSAVTSTGKAELPKPGCVLCRVESPCSTVRAIESALAENGGKK